MKIKLKPNKNLTTKSQRWFCWGGTWSGVWGIMSCLAFLIKHFVSLSVIICKFILFICLEKLVWLRHQLLLQLIQTNANFSIVRITHSEAAIYRDDKPHIWLWCVIYHIHNKYTYNLIWLNKENQPARGVQTSRKQEDWASTLIIIALEPLLYNSQNLYQ